MIWNYAEAHLFSEIVQQTTFFSRIPPGYARIGRIYKLGIFNLVTNALEGVCLEIGLTKFWQGMKIEKKNLNEHIITDTPIVNESAIIQMNMYTENIGQNRYMNSISAFRSPPIMLFSQSYANCLRKV